MAMEKVIELCQENVMAALEASAIELAQCSKYAPTDYCPVFNMSQMLLIFSIKFFTNFENGFTILYFFHDGHNILVAA